MKYRMLKVGEIIREGDQCSSGGQHWFEVFASIGERVGDCDMIFFRRPITQPTNKMKKKTVSQKVVAALKSGPKTLTYLTNLTKSTKVSTRISDTLRPMGYKIDNVKTVKMVKGEKKITSKYTLISTPSK